MLASVSTRFEPRWVGVDVVWEAADEEAWPYLSYFCWSCGAESDVPAGMPRPRCCDEPMSLNPRFALAV
jgi:hypothetical protein